VGIKILERLILTPGEPAGIGPDLVIQLAQEQLPASWCVVADPIMLAARAQQLRIPIEIQLCQQAPPTAPPRGVLAVLPVYAPAPVIAGHLDRANAFYVLECLRQACTACETGEFDALITGPVHKGIINAAGIAFSGHTEYLAHLTHSDTVVMMLATPRLRVALASTHLPLAHVSAAITAPRLEAVIRVLHHSLCQQFGIQHPHIRVCGLNPHAGEDGHLGREEIDIIIPVLDKLRAEGMNVSPPVPADTAFIPSSLNGVDAVLCMYHDQGLPVLKAQGFGEAINITLGLPIIRISVDHGTALTLAGCGHADIRSLRHACHSAIAWRCHSK
jgi:4-hydroxythreonine-4-phosphate dehydrogenase